MKKRGYGRAQRYFREVVMTHESDDCLIWPFARNAGGYAVGTDDEGNRGLVSRRVCRETCGPPPSSAHEAAHSCNNGHLGCVNRGHISWKTPQQNADDRTLNGKIPRGGKHGNAKLTDAAARQVLGLRGTETRTASALRYGVSRGTIYRIQTGKGWRHIE